MAVKDERVEDIYDVFNQKKIELFGFYIHDISPLFRDNKDFKVYHCYYY